MKEPLHVEAKTVGFRLPAPGRFRLVPLDSSARYASRCLAASGGSPPFGALRHHLRHGVKRVTRFSGRYTPLRIVFPCHPAERWDNNASLNSSLKNCSMSKAGCCAPASGGTMNPRASGPSILSPLLFVVAPQAPEPYCVREYVQAQLPGFAPLSEASTTLSPRVSAGLSPLRRRRAPPPAFGNTAHLPFKSLMSSRRLVFLVSQ